MFKKLFKKTETARFEKIIPMEKIPINFDDYPFRVIVIKNGKAIEETNTKSEYYDEPEDDEPAIDDDYYYDYDYEPEDEEEDFVDTTYYEEETDNWEPTTYYEEEDTREQFDRIDFARTDWNTYDINNIIF